eukprot:366119-Chlamydomonas_euryale.AAC.22
MSDSLSVKVPEAAMLPESVSGWPVPARHAHLRQECVWQFWLVAPQFRQQRSLVLLCRLPCGARSRQERQP